MCLRLILIATISSIYCMGDVLVTKDGKIFTIPGSYEVKGKFVRYRDERNELLQLPLSMIDLDASEKATKEAKEALNKVAAPKKEVKKQTIADMAKDLDLNREEDYEPPTNVSINSKEVKKYHVDQSNSAHENAYTPGVHASEVMNKRSQFSGEYNKLADEIDSLDKEIEINRKALVGFRNESNFGDDLTGAAYENVVRTEKQIQKLTKERAEKYKALKKIEKEARVLGDKGMARKRPVKKLKKEEFSEDDLEYRPEEDDFEDK
ncbi:MAG: hypothetical protein CR997_06240 [Acidobacteria bacterium]|nr:MAG: hypothetical protein CR997_06240 [Acidobacteriota bacterium]